MLKALRARDPDRHPAAGDRRDERDDQVRGEVVPRDWPAGLAGLFPERARQAAA